MNDSNNDNNEEVTTSFTQATGEAVIIDTPRKRKRLTAAQERTNLEKVCKMYNDEMPILVIQKQLGISEVQLKNYLCELFIDKKVTALDKKDNVVRKPDIQKHINEFFANDPKDMLYELDESGDGIMICRYNHDTDKGGTNV